MIGRSKIREWTHPIFLHIDNGEPKERIIKEVRAYQGWINLQDAPLARKRQLRAEIEEDVNVRWYNKHSKNPPREEGLKGRSIFG